MRFLKKSVATSGFATASSTPFAKAKRNEPAVSNWPTVSLLMLAFGANVITADNICNANAVRTNFP